MERPTLRWLTPEGNSSAEEYMWSQQQEMESIIESVRHKFDGWPIQYWDIHWDKYGERWIIEIHPAEPIDITGYYIDK